MVGDYLSTSFVAGKALSVFAAATPGSCVLGNILSCNEMMVAPASPLRATGGTAPLRTNVLYRGSGVVRTTRMTAR